MGEGDCMKLKLGDKGQDGRIFWAYNKACKNGEYWMSIEKFQEYHARVILREKTDPWCKRPGNREKRFLIKKANRERNREKIRAYQREYRKLNLEKIKEYKKVNDLKNKGHINEYARAKYHSSAMIKCARLLRSRMGSALRKKGFQKKNKTEVILGCTIPEFMIKMEKFFDPRMTWENRGELWDLDHTRALSLADTVEEMEGLGHFSNQRPMFWLPNLMKSDRTDWTPEEEAYWIKVQFGEIDPITQPFEKKSSLLQ
jgi:hypothetical protein